ncbi:MAG: hypothetical protein LQ342_001392 [Letrouitia transgressa]|nr:MAG: hypothetical protein LQ342_001392 [Letrouitia transgressa]
MDPTPHRKIDLQSPADLAYLHANIRSAAQQKLDLAIPTPATATADDAAFRARVQQLVHEFIAQTLTLALPSLAINGLDAPAAVLAPEPDAGAGPGQGGNYEPYDAELAETLRTLYRRLEWEHTRVAELRREAPGAAARAYVERVEGEMAGQRAAEEEEMERGEEAEARVEGSLGQMMRVERLEQVERMWGRGVEGLLGLEKITGVLAKLERATKVAEVVEGI